MWVSIPSGLRDEDSALGTINHIQAIYRIIYLKGYNVTQALEIIEAKVEATPERDEILSFIANSSRGIMKGYSKIREK